MSEPAKGSERSSNSSRKASTTVSTRSSRRTASPSRASKQDDAGPPTPESPPFRLTRKRAASLADKADGRDEQPDGTPEEVGDEATDIAPTNTTHSRMSSGGASAGSAGSAASHVCLCQPDPKIPRPRNGQLAFFYLPTALVLLCLYASPLLFIFPSLRRIDLPLPSVSVRLSDPRRDLLPLSSSLS